MGLFLFTSAAQAQQQRRYEISVGYEGLFLGEGDVGAQAYRVEVARTLFSNRIGLALSLSYQRAVNKSLRAAVLSRWKDKHTYVADLALFYDVLRFEYKATGHRLRLSAGPSVQRRYGENPRSLQFPIVFKLHPERLEELKRLVASAEGVNFYQEVLEKDEFVHQQGTYVLITVDRRGTDFGAMLAASYGLTYRRFFGEVGIVWRYYQNEYLARGWVFSLGLKF